MSETKKHRKIEEIQGEYQGLCTKLGHLEYQIDALKNESRLVKSTLRDLNLEGAAAHGAAAKEAEELAKSAKPEESPVSTEQVVS